MLGRPKRGETDMSKTKSTGKSRLSVLLGLTGLLSFATATTVRAQDDPGYDDPNGNYSARGGDDGRYNNSDDLRYNDPRYDNGNDSRYGDQDPPSRVARLSYFDGSVSFQAGGNGDWGNAAKNRPITIGDKLWVDKDARAELQAGQATIHLGGMTALSFLNLDQNITQMRLAEGSINFRVRELREGDTYEVDTPNVAFTVREAGVFRIDVNETGDGTIVTVIRGEGEVTAGGKSYDVRAGELAEFNGTDSNVEYRPDRAPDPDDFDRWAADRDRREEDSVSARYVSRDMVGYSDLDDHGTWRDEPEYGHVWYPNNVSVGWAPYSNGYWSYVGPWGWTWVDYEPWGFAPFHYGRWNYFGGRWGWCPGPINYYPVYGPAFVGFLGGGGFGFGVGLGVGWFPLGFGEVYRPWYRCGGGYLRNVNVHNTYIRNVNNINIANNHYAYAHNPAAVTATTHNNFVNGQVVNRGSARVTSASLRGTQPTNHVALTPTKASYTGMANAQGRVVTPPTSVQNRAVIARTAPAAGASHLPVRTVGPATVTGGNNTYAATRGGRATVSQANTINGRPSATYNNSNGAATNYGNRPSATYSNRSTNNSLATNSSRADRPAWAGSGANPAANSQNASRPNTNRPPSANTGRTYTNDTLNSSPRSYAAPSGGNSNTSPSRPPNGRTYTNENLNSSPRADSAPSGGNTSSSRPPTAYNGRTYNDRGSASAPRPYAAPDRSYSAPQRPYSAPPQRGYSAPPQQRTYSAPAQRSYSAPPQQRAYSAPSPTYSAPSHASPAPSRGASGPSGGGHPSGGGGGGNRGGSGPHGR
jgi:hypothetical protein